MLSSQWSITLLNAVNVFLCLHNARMKLGLLNQFCQVSDKIVQLASMLSWIFLMEILPSFSEHFSRFILFNTRLLLPFHGSDY